MPGLPVARTHPAGGGIVKHWTQGADHPLLGRDVLIHWRDHRNDWHAYMVIGYFDGWLMLCGRAENGDPFEGGDIMVPLTDIEFIETAEGS